MVDQVIVGVSPGDRFVQVSCSGDAAGEVAVEVVAVAGVAQQPERLDDVDPSPTGNTLGQPQQRMFASSATSQRLGSQRPEPMRQQADGLDQRDEFVVNDADDKFSVLDELAEEGGPDLR
ncbi:hypothetical protein [Micromonospora sp. NPDC049171]|uniref:hypothetical protein n=1 Tax=Micromonospora sp. NPDC049171 TaxID=3155770 RepID=UPI0033F9034B